MRRTLVIFALCCFVGDDGGVLLPSPSNAAVATDARALGRLGMSGDRPASAWHLPSFEGLDADVIVERLAALADLVRPRAARQAGGELAHARPHVPASEPTFEGLYALAGEVEVPVLLHTASHRFPARRRIRTTMIRSSLPRSSQTTVAVTDRR